MTEAPPVICGPPQPPSNGSVNTGIQSLPHYAEGTTVTFQCDDGLFPNDTRSIACGERLGLVECLIDLVESECEINLGKD